MKHLKVGDKAPNFETIDQNGKPVKLADFNSEKIVLYFYPKDNTPGCTKQACDLRDNFSTLKKEGYTIFGISADSAEKHRNFISKYDLPFDLLMDEEKKIIESYGVWGPKKFMGKTYDGIHRTTFIIEEGFITRIIDKVKTNAHSAQILND